VKAVLAGVGIGALVAIHSFTGQLQAAVGQQGRELLGADLVLGCASPFTPRAEREIAEIAATPGAAASRITRFTAMAFVPGSGSASTRLVQVTAVDGPYPFYGAVRTTPEAAWERLPAGDGVIVDPALLLALGARVGDTLALGDARLAIVGEIAAFPGDVSIRSAFGPRVFLAARRLAETHVLGFGARVRYEVHVKLPPASDGDRVARSHRAALAEERVSLRTVAQEQENLSRSLGRIGQYLGLVALGALLLAGLAVTSAVHVFIKRRMETLAVLRCLGASSGQLMGIFLLQALALGIVASAAGVAFGVVLQAMLPRVFAGFLPVGVSPQPSLAAMATGAGLGIWVAVVAALLPLLAVRRISPLAVFRRPYEDTKRVPLDAARVGALLAAAGSVVALAIVESRDVRVGLAFAGAIGVVVGALTLAAWTLTRGVRRFFPAGWPYVWRQGIANLFRPANQTVMVVLALGFGAFLLDTLFIVQQNLLSELRVEGRAQQPNVVLFDIQPDQRPALEKELQRAGATRAAAVPVVPMRIRSVNGVLATSTLSRSAPAADTRDGWTLRREYRSTYRDAMTATERTAAGVFWTKGAAVSPAPISIEKRLARELQVRIGDEIEWDVQGVAVRSRVVHLRDVDWARFEPNFFVVFASGPLDHAPQSYVMLTRVEAPVARVRFARHVVEAFPNVSVVDVTDVQRAIENVLSRAAQAVSFIASFSLLTGVIVLVGAVSTSRQQRLREAVLLRTLGATRAQLLRIAFAEYVVLGLLGVAVGLALSVGAGWALTHFVFDQRFVLPLPSLFALGAMLVALCVTVGVSSGLEILRRPPLEELRAE
jgi:putative ABC transport system permease protein